MKVLWVFAHPEPRSLNASLRNAGIAALEAAGHEVRQSDLYAMGWKAVADAADFPAHDPAARLIYADASGAAFRSGTQAGDVTAEQAKVMWADALIFQFPLWWFSAPAILKGWFDRVLAAGWAYRVPNPANPKWTRRYGDGTLKGKRALLVVSAGGSAVSLGPRGVAGDINDLLFPITYGVCWFTGMAPLKPHVINNANRVTAETYTDVEQALLARLAVLDREAPIPYRTQDGGDYDDDMALKPGREGAAQGLAMRLRDEP